jgi:hypothetical protein
MVVIEYENTPGASTQKRALFVLIGVHLWLLCSFLKLSLA